MFCKFTFSLSNAAIRLSSIPAALKNDRKVCDEVEPAAVRVEGFGSKAGRAGGGAGAALAGTGGGPSIFAPQWPQNFPPLFSSPHDGHFFVSLSDALGRGAATIGAGFVTNCGVETLLPFLGVSSSPPPPPEEAEKPKEEVGLDFGSSGGGRAGVDGSFGLAAGGGGGGGDVEGGSDEEGTFCFAPQTPQSLAETGAPQEWQVVGAMAGLEATIREGGESGPLIMGSKFAGRREETMGFGLEMSVGSEIRESSCGGG
jgi:hypothetical protein